MFPQSGENGVDWQGLEGKEFHATTHIISAFCANTTKNKVRGKEKI